MIDVTVLDGVRWMMMRVCVVCIHRSNRSDLDLPPSPQKRVVLLDMHGHGVPLATVYCAFGRRKENCVALMRLEYVLCFMCGR